MNVYHLKNSNEPEGQWVKFESADGLQTLMQTSEESAFFSAYARIAIQRHKETSSKGSKAKLADLTRLGAFSHPVLSEHARSVFEPYLAGLGDRLGAAGF